MERFNFAWLILLALAVSNFASPAAAEKGYTFNRNLVGVTFSPYVKNWESTNIPGHFTYSISDIQIMLRLINTRFSKISTYGIGAEGALKRTPPFAEERVTIAAAELNRHERTNLSIIQGIRHHKENAGLQNLEITNAINITLYANSISPGTVNAFVVPVENSNAEVLESMLAIKNGSQERLSWPAGLKLGARTNNCTTIAAEIVQQLDLIMCTIYPPYSTHTFIKTAVNFVQQEFNESLNRIRLINPTIKISIGETGWPSNGPDTTLYNLGNLKEYWESIDKLAIKEQIEVYLFEAIDQPYKSNPAITNKDSPNGRFGLGGNYGWWKRTDTYNNNPNTYIEKIVELPKFAEPSSTPNLILYLIIPIVSSIIIAGFIGYFCYNKKIRDAQLRLKLTDEEIKEFENGAISGAYLNFAGTGDYINVNSNALQPLNIPYNKDYEIPKTDLEISRNKVLGSGAFGIVYHGVMVKNGTPVAVKTIKKGTLAKELKNLLSEIKIMSFIGKHENVVSLVGALTTELRLGCVYLVIEFCSLGSLESYLRKVPFCDLNTTYVDLHQEGQYCVQNEASSLDIRNPGEKLTPIAMEDMLRWSAQIANGMEYLTAKNIVHADLASRNVLLTNDRTAKITDFGLSRRLYEYTQYVKKNQEPLPWRWMAIESLRNMTFSSHSDVWSYGVTLWEIFSLGGIPYPGLSWDIGFLEELDGGLRLSKPRHASIEIYELMTQTWHEIPTARPNFVRLKEFFQQILLNYNCDHETELQIENAADPETQHENLSEGYIINGVQ